MSHQGAKFTELSVELQHLYQMHCLHFPHLYQANRTTKCLWIV